MAVTSGGRVLRGWQAIADYLGIDKKTAQRYERLKGLPVIRPAGKNAVVTADSQELDVWIRRDFAASPPMVLDPVLQKTPTPPEPVVLATPGLPPAQVVAADQVPPLPAAYLGATSALYALLYVLALFLEIAYRFGEFGSGATWRAPLVFVWIFSGSFIGMTVDWKLTVAGKSNGLWWSLIVFLSSAIFLYAALSSFLPPVPVTGYRVQAQTAQAAYLKDVALYFLPLALLLGAVPLHIAAVLWRTAKYQAQFVSGEVASNDQSQVLKIPQLPPPYLWAALFLTALLSIAMTNRLFDNLTETKYTNLFMLLALGRVMTYFSLGILYLSWYTRAVQRLELESIFRPPVKAS